MDQVDRTTGAPGAPSNGLRSYGVFMNVETDERTPAAAGVARPGEPDAAVRQEPAVRLPEAVPTPAADVAATGALPATRAGGVLELSPRIAARQARLRSTRGVRGAFNRVGFRFGLSPGEQRDADRREVIRTALPAVYQVAVLGVKGGVGRTTVTAALGSTFAKVRSDRVVAVDLGPHFGDLANRVAHNKYGLTLRDLVHANNIEVFSEVLGYTATNAADLCVLASSWRIEAADPFSGEEYGRAFEILRRHFNLVLVDCGAAVLDSAVTKVLETSSAVVIVTSSTYGGLNGAVATFNWLRARGMQHLIAKAVVAIVDQHPGRRSVDLGAVEDLFEEAGQPTFRIPFDSHLAEGRLVDQRLLERQTRSALEDLAAGLASEFPMRRGEPR
ncbi:MAG: MinD/ParA family protein [Mycobacteriaceae bacterium]|nr:MinD/ParA family protein [Mycobacteriaceae bacterium]